MFEGYSRENFQKTKENIDVQKYSVEIEKEHRAQRIAEFKKDIKENPISILTIIDLLPTNLDVLLAKRRLYSAEKKLSGLEEDAQKEAIELNQKYEELKQNIIKSGNNFKEALQKLSDFEINELGMSQEKKE